MTLFGIFMRFLEVNMFKGELSFNICVSLMLEKGYQFVIFVDKKK